MADMRTPQALDLLLASKLDSFIQCVVEQSTDPSLGLFDRRFQPYAKKAVKDYTVLLQQYYDEAWKKPGQTVEAPVLTFTMLDGK